MEEKKFQRSDRSIAEVLDSCRKTFIKENGRLLTEEEAVEFIDLMRKDLKEKGLI